MDLTPDLLKTTVKNLPGEDLQTLRPLALRFAYGEQPAGIVRFAVVKLAEIVRSGEKINALKGAAPNASSKSPR